MDTVLGPEWTETVTIPKSQYELLKKKAHELERLQARDYDPSPWWNDPDNFVG